MAFTVAPLKTKKENIHWVKSRNWEMKEDKTWQKSRQDSGPLRDFSLSCVIPGAIMVIQISRALL